MMKYKTIKISNLFLVPLLLLSALWVQCATAEIPLSTVEDVKKEINICQKAGLIPEFTSPKIIGEVNPVKCVVVAGSIAFKYYPRDVEMYDINASRFSLQFGK